MNNKITPSLFRYLAVALVASSLIGCTETILSEHESKTEALADSIPKRETPSVTTPTAPYDDEDSGEGDTIKITVGFDPEWQDTVTVDVTGSEGQD